MFGFAKGTTSAIRSACCACTCGVAALQRRTFVGGEALCWGAARRHRRRLVRRGLKRLGWRTRRAAGRLCHRHLASGASTHAGGQVRATAAACGA